MAGPGRPAGVAGTGCPVGAGRRGGKAVAVCRADGGRPGAAASPAGLGCSPAPRHGPHQRDLGLFRQGGGLAALACAQRFEAHGWGWALLLRRGAQPPGRLGALRREGGGREPHPAVGLRRAWAHCGPPHRPSALPLPSLLLIPSTRWGWRAQAASCCTRASAAFRPATAPRPWTGQNIQGSANSCAARLKGMEGQLGGGAAALGSPATDAAAGPGWAGQEEADLLPKSDRDDLKAALARYGGSPQNSALSSLLLPSPGAAEVSWGAPPPMRVRGLARQRRAVHHPSSPTLHPCMCCIPCRASRAAASHRPAATRQQRQARTPARPHPCPLAAGGRPVTGASGGARWSAQGCTRAEAAGCTTADVASLNDTVSHTHCC